MPSYRLLPVLLCSTLLVVAVMRSAVAGEDGAKIFAESCSPCHSAKIRPLDNKHLTRERWKETVERMIDQGAEVSKAKKPELLDYLVRTHGPAGTGTSGGEKGVPPKNPGN